MDPQQQNQPIADNVPQVEEPVANIKQQIVEKVNGAKNVLVTVGSDPSVDELASALGLTFLLGKLGKHVTAVFSGTTPPAIDFLDPDKTFERSVDSLRDFIIALDKEKADKLRYKVEDDVVKVFITPYKTTISEKDLQFSQGDYNVDVVIAIGISNREDLDKAIVAHGRILHDAEVLTINANDKKSSLGSIDWADSSASSIAEMLVSISESFGSGLIDEQISTAFLTGIVAETNRFSNEKTSPKVMTMSAQLMAAGANQQLIASNLRQEGMISESIRNKKADEPHEDDAEMVLSHDDDKTDTKAALKQQNNKNKSKQQNSTNNDQKPTISAKPEPKIQNVKPEEPTETVAKKPAPVELPPLPGSQTQDSAKVEGKPYVSSAQDKPVVEPTKPASAPVNLPPLPAPKVEPEAPVEPLPEIQPKHDIIGSSFEDNQITQTDSEKDEAQKPSFGGTLNATTGQAEQDRFDQEQREKESNNTILEHGGDSAAEDAVAAARAALEDVSNEMPFDPKNNPTQSVGAQQLPPIHDDNPQQPVLPPLPAMDPMVPDPSAGQIQHDAAIQKSAEASEPSPVDAFMQPHADSPQAPNMPNNPIATPAGAAPQNSDLPPLPPMPPMPNDVVGGVMPPPPPSQPTDPTAGFQPQVGPAFMQGVPQSENPWTEAGKDVASKQAEKDATRQAKLDQLGAQYDAAADKNREMQGLPPINDDHTTFPLPPTN
jgi:nanoRNase/pAp phosphatase (c-di-AMP/oligoRNAs hydrolase)